MTINEILTTIFDNSMYLSLVLGHIYNYQFVSSPIFIIVSFYFDYVVVGKKISLFLPV